jgi:hypothetical protein
MGYLRNPTDIRENCVLRHLKVPFAKNWIDPVCENFVAQHNLSDCVQVSKGL